MVHYALCCLYSLTALGLQHLLEEAALGVACSHVQQVSAWACAACQPVCDESNTQWAPAVSSSHDYHYSEWQCRPDPRSHMLQALASHAAGDFRSSVLADCVRYVEVVPLLFLQGVLRPQVRLTAVRRTTCKRRKQLHPAERSRETVGSRSLWQCGRRTKAECSGGRSTCSTMYSRQWGGCASARCLTLWCVRFQLRIHDTFCLAAADYSNALHVACVWAVQTLHCAKCRWTIPTACRRYTTCVTVWSTLACSSNSSVGFAPQSASACCMQVGCPVSCAVQTQH